MPYNSLLTITKRMPHKDRLHPTQKPTELFEQVEKKGLKVVFGLEAQGHIPTIQAEIKRWNDSYKEQFPNEEALDMTYSKHVWDGIGKIIHWCPFTAALDYFEWLNKANQ